MLKNVTNDHPDHAESCRKKLSRTCRKTTVIRNQEHALRHEFKVVPRNINVLSGRFLFAEGGNKYGLERNTTDAEYGF